MTPTPEERNSGHGMSATRFYRIWEHVKGRSKIKNLSHATVCDRWRSFLNFKVDMYKSYLAHIKKHGEKQTSIDRIDTLKGYSPENCRWANQEVQQNNRMDNVRITHKGRTKTLAQWARILGVSDRTLYLRRNRGWSARRILETPYSRRMPIVIEQRNLKGKLIKVWPSVTSAAKFQGFDHKTILEAVNGKAKSRYGYIWKRK